MEIETNPKIRNPFENSKKRLDGRENNEIQDFGKLIYNCILFCTIYKIIIFYYYVTLY